MHMFPCVCGKIHLTTGINLTSTCTCGRNLFDQVFGYKPAQA